MAIYEDDRQFWQNLTEEELQMERLRRGFTPVDESGEAADTSPNYYSQPRMRPEQQEQQEPEPIGFTINGNRPQDGERPAPPVQLPADYPPGETQLNRPFGTREQAPIPNAPGMTEGYSRPAVLPPQQPQQPQQTYGIAGAEGTGFGRVMPGETLEQAQARSQAAGFQVDPRRIMAERQVRENALIQAGDAGQIPVLSDQYRVYEALKAKQTMDLLNSGAPLEAKLAQAAPSVADELRERSLMASMAAVNQDQGLRADEKIRMLSAYRAELDPIQRKRALYTNLLNEKRQMDEAKEAARYTAMEQKNFDIAIQNAKPLPNGGLGFVFGGKFHEIKPPTGGTTPLGKPGVVSGKPGEQYNPVPFDEAKHMKAAEAEAKAALYSAGKETESGVAGEIKNSPEYLKKVAEIYNARKEQHLKGQEENMKRQAGGQVGPAPAPNTREATMKMLAEIADTPDSPVRMTAYELRNIMERWPDINAAPEWARERAKRAAANIDKHRAGGK